MTICILYSSFDVSLFYFVAGFALLQVGLASSNSIFEFSWGPPDPLLENSFTEVHLAFPAGKFVGWRMLLSIMESLTLDFGYLCYWISSKRTSNYFVTLGRCGFSWPITVDSNVDPVSHSAWVEMINCIRQIERDSMTILHIWMDCVSWKRFRDSEHVKLQLCKFQSFIYVPHLLGTYMCWQYPIYVGYTMNKRESVCREMFSIVRKIEIIN